MITHKPGVVFRFTPVILHILTVLSNTKWPWVITSAADSHGPTDPHTRGEALDLRSHDLSEPDKVFWKQRLATLFPPPVFLVLLEPRDRHDLTDDQKALVAEHFHVQVAKHQIWEA